MAQAQESADFKPARRVLIIDDEDYVRQFMSLMLGSWGYEVTASAKIEASDLAILSRNDLIFVDMMMPGADGIQTLESLSRLKVKSAIVLMSGTHADVLASAERIARQQGLRVAGILKKPFRARELRRLLEEEPQERRAHEWQRPSPEINIEDVVEGLERQEFDTHLQPIVALATGHTVGYEALARWQSEKFSWVTPDRFIGVAARNGILPRLTRQVANRALDHASEFRHRGLASRVSINIGVEDLMDPLLPETLAELVGRRGLPPHTLIVELTESSATSNETRMLAVLSRLRLKGIDIAIDDFGTAYSSLDRLNIGPFSVLKIDMRFIRDIVSSANARTIVETSIGLAKRMNLTTVAEGVESEAQRTILKDLACDWAQGYLFARPMMFSDTVAWAEENRAITAA